MEVHAPHGAINTWREFFIHLVIITLGLLIALGLEGTVEWFHERHLLHTAEANLRVELQQNRSAIIADLKSLDAAQKQAQSNMAILKAYRNKKKGEAREVNISWQWNSPSSAAWDTARNTGAVALMDYQAAQKYSDTYTQQSWVIEQSSAYLRDVNKSVGPLQGEEEISEARPEDIDMALANVQQTIADVLFLHDLCNALSHNYDETLNEH